MDSPIPNQSAVGEAAGHCTRTRITSSTTEPLFVPAPDACNRINRFERTPGIEIGYLSAAIEALHAARFAVMAQPPPLSLMPGTGKAGSKLFDAVAEHAIADRLLAYNSRCVIVTEEAGVIGEKKYAALVSYVVDPFDRSRPFFRTVRGISDAKQYRNLGELFSDTEFNMRALEAPFGSITCILDLEIAFNAMIDYASGRVYVACKGFVGYGDINSGVDPRSLVRNGHELSFSPRSGSTFLCFTGDPDKDQDASVNEQSTKYGKILSGLGFDEAYHLGLSNPGGPARVLYLSDLYEDDGNPLFVLSNGEKVFEFLGWLAYALYSRELAVYELYSAGFEARGLILQAPPPNYSAFEPRFGQGGFRLHVDRVIRLDPAGQYRGAIVVTHARSTTACALMRSKTNSRELYHPVN